MRGPAFDKFEINPASPGEALNTAMGYGFLKSSTPNVVVSDLPEDIFQDTLSRGSATVEKVPRPRRTNRIPSPQLRHHQH